MGKYEKNKGGGLNFPTFYLFLIGVAVLTDFLMLITFAYTDARSITAWSLNFWDVLFQGNLQEFYQYSTLNLRNAPHAVCGGNYLWLLPLCIWNLPLWGIHSLTGIMSVEGFFSLCWSKLFFLILMNVTAYFSYKICYKLTQDREKAFLTALLFLLSPEALLSVGYAGQDEIVYITLFVAALYCYFEGRWKWCYWLMFVCVTLCPIMALPVLALLLLKEKNVYKVAVQGAVMVLPLILFELFYRNDAVYQEVKQSNDFYRMVEGMLLTTKVTLNNRVISLCGILLCVILFFCYIAKEEDNDAYRKKVIYIMAGIFAAICFLMLPNRFYRMFLYVPFLLLLIMTAGKNFGMNLLLFTVVTYGRAFFSLRAEYPQNMNTAYVIKNSWITKLCDLTGSTAYLAKTGKEGVCLWTRFYESSPLYQTLVSTCAFAAMLLLFIINNPKYRQDHEITIADRLLITACAMCMPILLAAFYGLLLL